jgi:hypothetical protein
MIAVECMVYWMTAEFMQGAFDAGEACLYLPILLLVERQRPNGGPPCELLPWRAL